MIKIFTKNNQPSFSILEIILLIALVSIAFLGVSGLLRQTLQLEGLAKNDFIGNALADEGIELVRAMRNDNVTSSIPAFTDIAMTGNSSTQYFKIDKNIKNFVSPGARLAGARTLSTASFIAADARLYFDPLNYYSHTVGASPTNFYRVIIATPEAYGSPARHKVLLSSVVTLLYRGKTYTYVRTTWLNDGQ